MAKRRVYQVAAEWGLPSRDLITHLERMGITGKKAQSIIEDADVERARTEVGMAQAAPSLRGQEGVKVAAIKPTVVIRRRKREEGDGQASDPGGLHSRGLQAPTSLDVKPTVLAAFEINEFAYASGPLALAVAQEAYEVSGAAHLGAGVHGTSGAAAVTADQDEEEFEMEPPVDEPEKLAEEILSAAAVPSPSREEKTEPARGTARILGRIDLRKKAVAPTPAAKEKEPEDAAKPEEGDKAGRKKKRKVVRKEDMFDAFERSFQARPRKKRAAPGQKVKQTEVTTPKASKRVVRINEVTLAGDLARNMGIKAGEILSSMMKLGVMKTINDAIDFETATLVADEFGYTVENTAVTVEDLLDQDIEIQGEELEQSSRPPVVTVMGHVDHGKTSLLDVIRKSDVVSSESGGITQHIGAYLVETKQSQICFLDTPGHAAFTAMRARGAELTDIVVLVVAADDGVMPQTIEAINHAKAADIPVVVAVNKIDRPDANVDRVKQQLSEHGLQPEDWGGEAQFIEVSALKKQGIEELLDAIALLAQIHELKASKEGRARGVVIESRLDRGRGPVATLLIQSGTLVRGESFVCGEVTGRIRAMADHKGRQLKSAGPSTPVEIIGLDGIPAAGDSFNILEDSSRAERVAEHRRDTGRQRHLAASAVSLEDLQQRVAEGKLNELKVILKADVHGSVEALKQALEKLGTDEVKLTVVHPAVGAITESDVQLALASQAIIIGFHVRPEGKARAMAEREGVDVRLHTIIYEAIDEVRTGLEGLLEPDFKEVDEGRAEVRETFRVPGRMIAGCYVTEGKIARGTGCRLLRDNVVIHTSNVDSLRRFKEDVKEVQGSYECGIGIERFNDMKVGDVIECFRIEEVRRSLDSAPRKT